MSGWKAGRTFGVRLELAESNGRLVMSVVREERGQSGAMLINGGRATDLRLQYRLEAAVGQCREIA